MGIDGSLLKKRGLSDAKVELGFAHLQEAVYIKKDIQKKGTFHGHTMVADAD